MDNGPTFEPWTPKRGTSKVSIRNSLDPLHNRSAGSGVRAGVNTRLAVLGKPIV
ncbi:hypothetical protein E4U54_002295 [Claviceps lovelessii]|nr:hypothetical protein E4U54_002295 [Claviceps lovelessii]